MTRFRSFTSKSFGLSDRARIRDGDKFHAACLLACSDRNFPPRRKGMRIERGSRGAGNRDRSPTVREPKFTDTSRGVLISCRISFLRPSSWRPRLPFREGCLTRSVDDSAQIIDSISSETYRRDVSRGYGSVRSTRSGSILVLQKSKSKWDSYNCQCKNKFKKNIVNIFKIIFNEIILIKF